jgi:hypothetical protein
MTFILFIVVHVRQNTPTARHSTVLLMTMKPLRSAVQELGSTRFSPKIPATRLYMARAKVATVNMISIRNNLHREQRSSSRGT